MLVEKLLDVERATEEEHPVPGKRRLQTCEFREIREAAVLGEIAEVISYLGYSPLELLRFELVSLT